jgi:cold shock CspA family protein
MSPAGAGVATDSEAGRRHNAPPRESVGIAGVTGGVVKWVDASRAHGAIATDLTAPWDIWFPLSCVDGQGLERLGPGDRVEVGYIRLDLGSFRYVAHLVRIINPVV